MGNRGRARPTPNVQHSKQHLKFDLKHTKRGTHTGRKGYGWGGRSWELGAGESGNVALHMWQVFVCDVVVEKRQKQLSWFEFEFSSVEFPVKVNCHFTVCISNWQPRRVTRDKKIALHTARGHGFKSSPSHKTRQLFALWVYECGGALSFFRVLVTLFCFVGQRQGNFQNAFHCGFHFRACWTRPQRHTIPHTRLQP